MDDIQSKMSQELDASLYSWSAELELLMAGEYAKQTDKGQWIVQVSQGIDEFRIPLSDEMCQVVLWFPLNHEFNLADIALSLCMLILPKPDLLVPKPIDK